MAGSRALHPGLDAGVSPSASVAEPGSGPPLLVPAIATLPSARRVFMLQREVLFRARAAIFGREGPLGGIPTLDEEAEQHDLDERAARAMTAALRGAVGEARAAGIPSGQFAGEAAEHWRAKTPAALAFGARTFDGLVLLSPRPPADGRWRFAAAAFQLAASLLDWIGDEAGAAREVAAALPPDVLRSSLLDAASRQRLAEPGPPEGAAVAAFRVVLGAMTRSVPDLGHETDRLWTALADAYAAELASFVPRGPGPADEAERTRLDRRRAPVAAAAPARLDPVAVALEKSLAPTVVIGELARLACGEAPGGAIDRARLAVAPVFALVDDLADLAADLRKGHLTTLAPAGPPLADPEVARVLEELLASSAVAAAAGRVVGHLATLDRLLTGAPIEPGGPPLAGAAIPPPRGRAAAAWLRVAIWRWLS